ncbi:hypothetical protein FHX15_006205 [Rhizobium sp. BK650]|uniref:hypothetical protein n=1 Tax=Rhizobium sp. BK650 TaxID=2586990 RepID=UPI001619E900|nr:hypothetical protein [Rhizobium sp. BK650]MBB3660933.1 hypothetical protein [Rhizobium sp. BK650]
MKKQPDYVIDKKNEPQREADVEQSGEQNKQGLHTHTRAEKAPTGAAEIRTLMAWARRLFT